MSSSIIQSGDCCNTGCADQTVSQVPGPQGPAGTNGVNGSNGINAFTTTTNTFTMPAVSSTVSIPVATSTWASIGQIIFVQHAGYFSITGIADSTHITGNNVGYSGNAVPTTVIASASTVSPGGLKGVDGSSGSTTLNDISPTTTKGDIIVDNGANSPNASTVRLGVGTDGKAFVADSSQPTGVNYKTITPNSATDNAVARYDGASGTPIPLQTSKFIVTDNGAAQASGSGGNARGTDAVDLQVTRAANTQVAAGTNSTVAGGANNTGSGNYSTVSGGLTNLASGLYSAAGGGTVNQATGATSVIAGGTTNTASGAQASILGGEVNVASGNWSIVTGGRQNIASGDYSSASGVYAKADKWGQRALSPGFSGIEAGDTQGSELIWSVTTTDATANVEMWLDGPLASKRATIASGQSWGFDIIMVGRSSAGVCAVWQAIGGIQNNGGTVSMIAACTSVVKADGTGATFGVAGSFTITADNTNKSLKLAVTGLIATSIKFVAYGRLSECEF